MGPKTGDIFHRGVYMGLKVAYKVFVGDDAGFLDQIYSLSDIDVDVAAWVRNGEEGVFNDHLVGNFHEMDPHVLEVGHQGIEVVVDDVCGGLASPFAGVGYDGDEVGIEVQ